jgi:hypothetical protein
MTFVLAGSLQRWYNFAVTEQNIATTEGQSIVVAGQNTVVVGCRL